jgi:hypothetical protein
LRSGGCLEKSLGIWWQKPGMLLSKEKLPSTDGRKRLGDLGKLPKVGVKT